MKRISRWIAGIVALAAFSAGGILVTNAGSADNLKPIGFETQSYNLNPEPILKKNLDKKAELMSKKENILKKIKLKENQNILSAKLKTWKEYKTTEGDGTENFEVDDNRLVWEVKIDAPDGVHTRGGYYRNAIQMFVVDAETEKLIEMRVHGDRDPASDRD